jgi:hypothetical protein
MLIVSCLQASKLEVLNFELMMFSLDIMVYITTIFAHFIVFFDEKIVHTLYGANILFYVVHYFMPKVPSKKPVKTTTSKAAKPAAKKAVSNKKAPAKINAVKKEVAVSEKNTKMTSSTNKPSSDII